MPANVKISIPVKVGGYTGQYDRWEEFERDHMVTLDDDANVVLENDGRKITINYGDLQEAVQFLRNGSSVKPPGPVYRDLPGFRGPTEPHVGQPG